MAILISFGVSLAGIVALLLFKRSGVGERSGFYQRLRSSLDRYVILTGRFLRAIPRVIRRALGVALGTILYRISNVILRVIRFLERRLLKTTNMIKGRGEINRKKGSASMFLTAISKEGQTESVDSSEETNNN